MLSYATMLCCAMLCYAMLCYALLCSAMLCGAMPCCAILCCAMLCCAMLCYAMLCHAMLGYALLCYATCWEEGGERRRREGGREGGRLRHSDFENKDPPSGVVGINTRSAQTWMPNTIHVFICFIRSLCIFYMFCFLLVFK